jgi:hypothetical protein
MYHLKRIARQRAGLGQARIQGAAVRSVKDKNGEDVSEA